MCERLLQAFIDLCRELGIPLVHERTEGPTTCLTFLGVELDFLAQQSMLLHAKLDKAMALLKAAAAVTKITLHDLQVLVERLKFACHVIALGRAFLRCLCYAMAGVR